MFQLQYQLLFSLKCVIQFIADNSTISSIGEVIYFFQCRVKGLLETLAVVSVFSSPLPHLFNRSHGTFISCKYLGDESVIVINVKCIKAVVAMVPHSPPDVDDGEKYYYLVERPGLDITDLGDFGSETVP